MIITLKSGATPEEIDRVCEAIREAGLRVHLVNPPVIAVAGTGNLSEIIEQVRALPGVASVRAISAPHKFASREFQNCPTAIRVGPRAVIGGGRFLIAAGPRMVSSERQISDLADSLARAGAEVLRAAAFDVADFRGVDKHRLHLLRAAADSAHLGLITEVMSDADIHLAAPLADVLEIGARNMQNFALLKVAGRCGRPVLLNRGANSTLMEWLMAAEYLLAHGNPNVILCEGGIRTFETHTRRTLDLSAVPALLELTHLPVLVDPAAATGRAGLVTSLSQAAVGAGADGILLQVEEHPQAGALGVAAFARLVGGLEPHLRVWRESRDSDGNLR